LLKLIVTHSAGRTAPAFITQTPSAASVIAFIADVDADPTGDCPKPAFSFTFSALFNTHLGHRHTSEGVAYHKICAHGIIKALKLTHNPSVAVCAVGCIEVAPTTVRAIADIVTIIGRNWQYYTLRITTARHAYILGGEARSTSMSRTAAFPPIQDSASGGQRAVYIQHVLHHLRRQLSIQDLN